ncbi:MAG: DUF1499 domain-containing protein [Rhodospirillaceae bacterium]|jgi:uncharacterized protein (DUF1499 family)|nr:DUF1499 domain-containing protein [Rhodospirillaceae bacterium]MBT5240437.1 DUF1499 domain-containing protein [Rhodospirillaceae bacterium]MBT5566695.1 DUF1499 domain-containing protein [Rhodospirillaceae bacterium]MBT6090746.1 DUF1499 domain-containing protein [Rhodospirillaceae bacterium]MBT7450949.1 DUF1499 domain-containing protein [Rhodospirillaceae bacterium]
MALFKLKPIDTIDFATLVRPVSPNTFLLCPSGFSVSAPEQEAPMFEVSSDTLVSAWLDMIGDQARTVEVDRSDNGFQRTFVQRTWFAGFPDVITVLFIALSTETSTLAVYSRSQYGISDLGANKKRITTWLSALAQRLD